MSTLPDHVKPNGEDLLENFELTAFAPYLLNQTMSQLDGNLRHVLKPHGLSIHQWRVLLMLRLRGAVSIGDISAGTVMGQSTITRVADQLEEANLANRSPLPDNHRVIMLSLTPKGRSLIEEVIPTVFAIHDGALEDFDEGERRLLFTMLKRLATNLHRHHALQKLNDSMTGTQTSRVLAG